MAAVMRRLFCFHRNLNRGVFFRGFSTPVIDPGVEGCENWELFKAWMLEYDKKYESEEETLFRYKVFCESQKEVEMWNKEENECKYALNFFADIRIPRDFPPYRDYVHPIHRTELRRAFDLTQRQVGVKKSLLKEAEGDENWGPFKSWMLEYNKHYNSQVETLYRYEVFCEAKKEVDRLNNEDTGCCNYTLNFFSDITPFDLPPVYRFGMLRFRVSRSTPLN